MSVKRIAATVAVDAELAGSGLLFSQAWSKPPGAVGPAPSDHRLFCSRLQPLAQRAQYAHARSPGVGWCLSGTVAQRWRRGTGVDAIARPLPLRAAHRSTSGQYQSRKPPRPGAPCHTGAGKVSSAPTK